MSKKIKELIEQSITIEEYGWGASYENFDREKFAQLIVRECADWVNDNVGLIDEEARADLMQHFGVEE